jgi:hypothetical protein
MGEPWLVFAARLRGRPTELRIPEPAPSWPKDFFSIEQVRGLLDRSIDLDTFEAELSRETDFRCFGNPEIRQWTTAADAITNGTTSDYSDLN